ncbi:SixA phosphatase family protein [Marinobacterium sedimentorum]|uniref:SixA phosphatase family protein n=1 Tax=Marinobacterium sedimentorum TaxID=2927804 RepID=UPI0020C6879C|nr:histidine phosphatase family protein [Marinobacterium sedimentorum]MCP8689446.1 histidine phosphatase family protein [Marinobacterium sedimentorum]
MKKLTLIRHSKSSWADPLLNDIDRPLNKRGESDLPLMAKRVRDFGLFPDRILTSGALRALTTAEALADTLELGSEQLHELPDLYESCSETLLHVLQQQPDHCHHLMLVGHSPGLDSLAYYLTHEALQKFPTSAVLHIHLSITRWCELADSCGTRELFDYPKLHRGLSDNT